MHAFMDHSGLQLAYGAVVFRGGTRGNAVSVVKMSSALKLKFADCYALKSR